MWDDAYAMQIRWGHTARLFLGQTVRLNCGPYLIGVAYATEAISYKENKHSWATLINIMAAVSRTIFMISSRPKYIQKY